MNIAFSPLYFLQHKKLFVFSYILLLLINFGVVGLDFGLCNKIVHFIKFLGFVMVWRLLASWHIELERGGLGLFI
jgi:hypothetical protein